MARSPGMMINEKVKLFEQLATGAMGEVWIAEHATLQTEVAVKFLQSDAGGLAPQEATERFSIEAAASAKIRSPHVVQTFDHGVTEDGTPYIVMELLEGQTLGQRLAESSPLPVDVVVDIVTQVGKAIDAAHALGIVHRDIKPDNIFLLDTPGGDVFAKVLDFGTAKQQYMDDARLTAPGTLIGTPQYMSRDQIVDPDHVSDAMDRWALAVVAYRCLTGVHPFRGNGPAEICGAIVEGELTAASELRTDLPRAVDTWFERAFDVDPACRPASGRALAEELRHALWTTPPPVATPPRPIEAPSPLPKVVGGVGVAMILSGAMLFARGSAVDAPIATVDAPPPEQPRADVATAPPASASATTPKPTTTAPVTPRAPDAILVPIRKARVEVPAGTTRFGCVEADTKCEDDERPGGALAVPPFRIDPGEVTVAAFRACVDAGVCSADGLLEPTKGHPFRCNWEKPAREGHPINCVDARQAATYCGWAGGRLPSETQWARAARGDDERVLPWGGVYASCPFTIMRKQDPGCAAPGTANVGSKPQGASPFGVQHLAGNVAEWTSDVYTPTFSPSATPSPGPSSAPRAVRGGSWNTPGHSGMRISERAPVAPEQRRPELGFRCVE